MNYTLSLTQAVCKVTVTKILITLEGASSAPQSKNIKSYLLIVKNCSSINILSTTVTEVSNN